MMVSAPNVNDFIKTAIELVFMISDIRGKIGALTISTAYHTVFFITKIGRFEPDIAIFFVQIAFFIEDL